MPRKAATTAGVRKAAAAPKSHKLAEKFPPGMVLKDVCKKEWRLGDVIGQGGFGLIYLASEASVDRKTQSHIVKIEPKDNGPLFCETHFYQRVAKPEFIKAFTTEHKLRYLSVPPYVAAGLEVYKSKEYRFLVMPRLGTDLQKLLLECGGQFAPQTSYAVGLRMVDALQFLHEKEYVHADIKAANILVGFSKGHDVTNEVYLVDYGLANRYTVGTEHKDYKEDPRRAHDGTIEFTSRDAHRGLAPSRRGDLEILGYCLLQWSCGKLPWENKLSDPGYVAKSKESFMDNLQTQLTKCIPDNPFHSGCLYKYFQQICKLEYHSKPNYDHIRDILRDGLTRSGQKNEWIIEFAPKGKKRKLADHGAVQSTPPPSRSPRYTSPRAKPSATLAKRALSPDSSRSPAVKRKIVAQEVVRGTPPVPTKNGLPSSSGARGKAKRVFSNGKAKKHFPMPAPTPLMPAATVARPITKRRVQRVKAVQNDMSVQTSPSLFNDK